jgi:uncharacterized delta-60 repeat protein
MRPQLEFLESRNLLNAGAADMGFGASGLATGPIHGGPGRFPFSSYTQATAAALESDGKIVQLGMYSNSQYQAHGFALVRYNTDGTVDGSFGASGGGGASVPVGSLADAIAIESDGKVLVAGGVPTSTGGEFTLWRFNPDGSTDATFGNQGTVNVFSSSGPGAAHRLALRPDGRIIVAGIGSASTIEVAGLNPNGSPDPSFSTTTINDSNGVGQVLVAPDGKIVVAGSEVYRLNVQGGLDGTWGTNGAATLSEGGSQATPSGIAVAANGQILMSGATASSVDLLGRFTPNGSSDPTFGGGTGTVTTSYAGGVLVQPDDRILLVGPFNLEVTRYTPTGTLDTTFGTNGVTSFQIPSTPDLQAGLCSNAALLQPDGKIVVGGTESLQPLLNGLPFGVPSTSWIVARYLGDTPTGTPSQRFVTHVYFDLLQRPTDPAGLASWSGLLDSGQANRTQVVHMIEASPEYHLLVINQIYGEYLRRSADPDGMFSWGMFLAAGGTVDQMRALVMGSPEYYQLAGGTNDAFVARVYGDVLGRAVDSGGQQTWDQALSAGADRGAVAGAIMRSTEGNGEEVQYLYHWLLHRPADAAGLQGFSAELAQGTPVEQLIAILAGSPEYAATRT